MYQNIDGFSAISSGSFLDSDALIQEDGSLLATRISVADPAAVDVVTTSVTEL